MKILQVNCVYREGSTGKIVFDMHTELQERGYQSVVAYGRGISTSEKNVCRTSSNLLGKINNAYSRITGIPYGGCYFETLNLIQVIKRENPDIVHLHCLNGFFVNIYMLLKWLGKQKMKIVLTQHAEFMYTGSCGYAIDCEEWKKDGCKQCPYWEIETRSLVGDRTRSAWKRMREAISFIDPANMRVISVSPWLMERAKQSNILKPYRHSVVFNGINTEVFARRDISRESVYPGMNQTTVVFHATAMFSSDKNHIKGGYYLLELAKQMQDQPIHFYVAGTYESGLQIPPNVTLLGRVSDQETLANYYSIADITLLTSKRETFSMVCAESLCCGTPVVGFCAGAPETISMPQYSDFVEFGNIDKLRDALKQMLDRALSKEEIAAKATEVYSRKHMVDEYCRVYEELYADRR